MLPVDLPRIVGGEVPGFFKVWGDGDDVWVVGAGGAIMHRKGTARRSRSSRRRRRTRSSPCTAPAIACVTVGGAGNGVLAPRRAKGTFKEASPPGAGLIQGVFATEHGDWASGERGVVYKREKPDGAFTVVDTASRCRLRRRCTRSSSTRAAACGRSAATCSRPRSTTGCSFTTASTSDPVVIAEEQCGRRTLRWQGRERRRRHGDVPRRRHRRRQERLGRDGAGTSRSSGRSGATSRGRPCTRETSFTCPLRCGTRGRATTRRPRASSSRSATPTPTSRRRGAPRSATRRTTCSRIATSRRSAAPITLACLRAVMNELGYDPNDTHDTGDDPIAFGNRIGQTIVALGATDGANEAQDYADSTYTIVNPPLVVRRPGHDAEGSDGVAAASTSPSRRRRTGSSCPPACRGTSARSGAASTPFAMKRDRQPRKVARPRSRAEASARR